MNAKKLACAPEDIDIHELWSKIDWDKCERFVQKLQARIVKAQREGRNNKVKALQWMLTHSFYAKALAVKRVTTNKGKSTSGVDKITFLRMSASCPLPYFLEDFPIHSVEYIRRSTIFIIITPTFYDWIQHHNK
jgi:hypothetical protein